MTCSGWPEDAIVHPCRSTGAALVLCTSNHSPQLEPPGAWSGSAISSSITIEPTGGVRVLHAPGLAGDGPYQPCASRCSDSPVGSVVDSDTPMSVEVVPLAGPLVAVNAPS